MHARACLRTLCFAVLGQDYFRWRRRNSADFSSQVNTSSFYGGNYGKDYYSYTASPRYGHPAEVNFRQFLDNSLARAASAAFRSFSAGGTGNLLTALVDGGLDVVAAAHHPIFGESQATRPLPATYGTLTTMKVATQGGVDGRGGNRGAVIKDLPRNPLPAGELSKGLRVEVNLAVDSRSAPRWCEAVIDRRLRSVNNFVVRADTGELVVPLANLRKTTTSIFWRTVHKALTPYDAAYLKPGEPLEVEEPGGRWLQAQFVGFANACAEYSVFVHDGWTPVKKIVAISAMRSCLTAVQRVIIEEQRDRARREADQRAIEEQCLLQDAANVHMSMAWERGSRTPMGLVAEEVWRNLVGVIGDLTRATEGTNIDDLQWSDAALLAKQDGQLRALAAKLPTFSAAVAASFPCDPLRGLPSQSFERQLHRHVEKLQADIQGTVFVDHEKLLTLNESDKQVRFAPSSRLLRPLVLRLVRALGWWAVWIHAFAMPARAPASHRPVVRVLCREGVGAGRGCWSVGGELCFSLHAHGACVCACAWFVQDFFATFLKSYDRVLAAVAVLALPQELVSVGIVCRAHISTQLERLSEAFNSRDFPPRGDSAVVEGVFDRINSAVASLHAFEVVCSAKNHLKSVALKLFSSAKTKMQDRWVRINPGSRRSPVLHVSIASFFGSPVLPCYLDVLGAWRHLAPCVKEAPWRVCASLPPAKQPGSQHLPSEDGNISPLVEPRKL
jgi:hypothetical protein